MGCDAWCSWRICRDGESLTLPQIAEREGISTANAGKLMWLLNKAGFVHSTRGTKGGYFLARPAGDIRLSEIIKVLDEDVMTKHCESYTGRARFVRSQWRLRHPAGDRRAARDRRKRFVADHAGPACRHGKLGRCDVSQDTGNSPDDRTAKDLKRFTTETQRTQRKN